MKHLLICGLFMVIASELQSQMADLPTPAEAKRYLTMMANSPPSKTDYDDPRIAAKVACGADYQNALKGVLQKEAAALKQLFLLSNCMGHESGKIHAGVLRATLAYVGDADFSEALKSVPNSIFEEVARNMVYMPSIDTAAFRQHVERAYPKTWSLLERISTR